MYRLLPGLLIALLLWMVPVMAAAEWIWTPRLGKWINPKKAAKETPELQLEHAMRAWEAKDYEKSLGEFRLLVENFPLAEEAPESQYYVGRSLEEIHEYYGAYKAYRKVIQVYPASTRTAEILERQYRIGNLFFHGEKREVLGYKVLSGMTAAIEVYQAIIDDAPYSDHGPLAMYKLGMCHKILAEFTVATSTFNHFLEEYPNHPLVDDTRFQIADCMARTSKSSLYDQTYTDNALGDFRQFVSENPESHLVPEAEERVYELLAKRAQHDFDVAQFYEGRKAWMSARVYYESIVARYPDTEWATQAATRVNELRQSGRIE